MTITSTRGAHNQNGSFTKIMPGMEPPKPNYNNFKEGSYWGKYQEE
jgi:hypothetical protein